MRPYFGGFASQAGFGSAPAAVSRAHLTTRSAVAASMSSRRRQYAASPVSLPPQRSERLVLVFEIQRGGGLVGAPPRGASGPPRHRADGRRAAGGNAARTAGTTRGPRLRPELLPKLCLVGLSVVFSCLNCLIATNLLLCQSPLQRFWLEVNRLWQSAIAIQVQVWISQEVWRFGCVFSGRSWLLMMS